jgi:polysaccharide pyruvyl transferase WcaK-like protein
MLKRKSREKVLLYSLGYLDNLGDDAMLIAETDFLNRHSILVDVVTPGNSELYFRNVKLAGNKKNFLQYSKCIGKLNQIPNICDFSVYDHIFTKLPCGFEINHYKAIIFGGGGYINARMDTREGKRLYNLIIKAKSLNIPVILVGQSFLPESGPNADLARSIIMSSDYVFVRERRSLAYCERIGKPAYCTGDDIFLLPHKKNERYKDSKYIVINIKDFEDLNFFLPQYIEMLEYLCDNMKKKVFVVPFRADRFSNEYLENMRLVEKLNGLGIEASLRVPNSTMALCELISGAYMCIGSAYHLTAFSIFCGTPIYTFFAGEYYTGKIGGILELFDLQQNILDINNTQKSLELASNLKEVSSSLIEEKRTNVIKSWLRIVEIIKGYK